MGKGLNSKKDNVLYRNQTQTEKKNVKFYRNWEKRVVLNRKCLYIKCMWECECEC